MKILVFVLAFLLADAQRPFCGGGSCTNDSNCSQPDGLGANVGGFCCNSVCYAQENIPTAKKGQTCNITLTCLNCESGYTCANSKGEAQDFGGTIVGPFTCQQLVTQFTPGCACKKDADCLGGICGSVDSKCYATGLYSGTSCSFSEQCISGYCKNGACEGRNPNVRTATCASDNECPLGYRCSGWKVPKVSICHGLSGEGGFCYDDDDCEANRFQIETQQTCVGGTSTTPGKCTKLPTLNQICATSTTTPGPYCGYYDGPDQTRLRYNCNSTIQRCVEQTVTPRIAIGQPCMYNAVDCVVGAYCDLLTHQPPTGPLQNGTCQAYGNVPKGGNCSFTIACGSNQECRSDNATAPYVCQDKSYGKPCNHTNSTLDSVYCPSANFDLVCGCNDTCIYADGGSNGVSGGSCSAKQDARFDWLFNSFDINNPSAAMAWYGGDRRAVVDRICCTFCGTTEAANALSRDVGVIIDCGSLTMSVPQICDSSSPPELAFKNCNSYTPNMGAKINLSFLIVFISSLFAFLAISNH